MNNHILNKINMINSFPTPLKSSKQIFFFAQIAAAYMQLASENIQTLYLYNNIGNLPEKTLDILAKDLSVEWYDYNYPLNIKQALIKNSFNTHRKIGTKGAMLSAVQNIYPNLDIQEWWEYGGNPFEFKILAVLSKSNTEKIPIKTCDVCKLVEIYKPARAKLNPCSILIYGSAVLNAGNEYTRQMLISEMQEGNSVCAVIFEDEQGNKLPVDLRNNWTMLKDNTICFDVSFNITNNIHVTNVTIADGERSSVPFATYHNFNYYFVAGETLNFKYIVDVVLSN